MQVRTERLYQRDSFLRRFSATVLDAQSEHAAGAAGSARLALVLDRTAFYPGGGGQPHDTGTLAGLPVVEVRESDAGPLHVVEMRDAQGRPRGIHLTVGATVDGVVEWGRRFDHIQQHSGQHILSRAFIETSGAATKSFHMGEAASTIDVEMARPGGAAIRAAESRANEIIWEDRPVQVREVQAEASAEGALPNPAYAELSLKPGDRVRIIEVEGFDETPCGGTHVARSGQVGLVSITAWERWKGICRVTFVCGGRAVTQLRAGSEALASCVSKLSARPHEIANALDRLLLDRAELQRRVRLMSAELTLHEAESLAASSPLVGPFRLLRKVYRSEERTIEDAQILARRFVDAPSRLALIAVTEGGGATLLASRSDAAAPGGAIPAPPKMGELIAEVCRIVGGRGGGAAAHARAGGIPEARVEEAIDMIIARLLAGDASGRS